MNSMTESMRKTAGYCQHGPKNWVLTNTGELSGYRLAVKDLFAVEGYKNAAGSPDWFESHEVATETAQALQLLMRAGAEFTGFTHTDELAYSLEGNNEHFGKSENPKLPGHACGGSSMGSAAAVASQWADIGLGTDTGGSIRVPASYCGLYGIRPSHGYVPVDGLIGLAPRFDTVGWFARNPTLLRKVGEQLLAKTTNTSSSSLLIDEQLMMLADKPLQSKLELSFNKISKQFKSVSSINLGLTSAYNELHEVFRILQGRAIANYHGRWIEDTTPKLSKAVETRMQMALKITDSEVREAEFVRQGFVTQLSDLLKQNATLFLPTTPTTAPLLGEDTSELRPRLLRLTAIAGLSGSAQVHLPLLPQQYGNEISRPFGFSLLQAPGNDLGLLNLVEYLTEQWNKDLLNEK